MSAHQNDTPAPGPKAALAAILIIAGVLRGWELDWGLPDFVFNDTRIFFTAPTRRILAGGSWLPQVFVHPPTLLYLVAAGSSIVQAMTAPPLAAGDIAWVGRVLTWAASTASVGALYLFLHRCLSVRAALLGATAFALAPFHVLEAHRVHTDAFMLLAWILSSHQAVIARDERSVGRLFLAFALVGLAGGFKYTGLVAGVVPAWIALTFPARTAAARARLLATGTLATGVAFAVLIAPLLADFEAFRTTLESIVRVGATTGQRGQNLTGEGWVYTRWIYGLVAALPFMMGWAIHAAGLAGLVLLAADPRARGPLLAGAIPFFVLQGGAETVVPRYFLPLSIYLAAGTGWLLDRASSRARAVGLTMTAVALLYTGALTASQLARIAVDRSPLVAELTERRRTQPPGSRLGVLYPMPGYLWYDPIEPFFRGRKGLRVEGLPPFARSPRGEPDAVVDRTREYLDRRGLEVVLVSSRFAALARREHHLTHEEVILEALADGRLGFERAVHLESRFLTQSWYTWADPMLESQLSAGIVGHTLYVRR